MIKDTQNINKISEGRTMNTNTNNTRTVVFTMGLPGAGKSTVANREMPNAAWIDPDEIKKSHPDYDPKNADAIHAWSQEETEKVWQNLLAGNTDDDITIMDGTGTNAEKMIRRIRQAQAAGFKAELFYVRVSLKTAIYRNANRERVVPEHIIRQKALDITTAFDICASEADAVQVINND